MFPQNPDMQGINLILSKCLVPDEEECFLTAGLLLPWVKTLAEKLKRGGEVFTDGIPRWCRVCGQGKYIPEFREKGKDDPTNTIALTRTVNGNGRRGRQIRDERLHMRPMRTHAIL
jgi:hypothetical protein